MFSTSRKSRVRDFDRTGHIHRFGEALRSDGLCGGKMSAEMHSLIKDVYRVQEEFFNLPQA